MRRNTEASVSCTRLFLSMLSQVNCQVLYVLGPIRFEGDHFLILNLKLTRCPHSLAATLAGNTSPARTLLSRSSHSLHSYFLLSRVRSYRATAEFFDCKLAASGERQ